METQKEATGLPNLNPSPKTRFRASGLNISEHRTLVESNAFQRACDFALLEYQAQIALTLSENPNLATVGGLKITGAQEFVMILRTISEMPRIVSRQPVQNLDHKI